jgi:hypothetical protein
MAAAQIDRTRWAPFLDALTNSLVGKQADIEVASLELGDQIETDWASLIGITYDHKDDLIEIALDEMDHLIRSPRELFVDYEVGGIVAIAIVDADGNRQIVRFRDPLALPAPNASAPRQAAR